MTKISKETYNRIAKLWQEVGGLSRPGKMPGYAWGIPTVHCKIGSQFWGVKDSICGICYARKGRYGFPKVQAAYERRFAAWRDNPHQWHENMIELLTLLQETQPGKMQHFRWFDSGDLQNAMMLQQIIDIAWVTPKGTQFWLPTREYSIVKEVLADHVVPGNLTIRMSAQMQDRILTLNEKHFGDAEVTTSAVASGKDERIKLVGWQCPARKQQNNCGACRACWSRDVPLVVYPAH